MEIEQKTPEIAKKMWCTIRAVFFMLRKGLSKSRIWFDLHMMLKRSSKVATKAIGNLILEYHYNALTCRSDDILSSFVSPREYEFSCRSSPAYPTHYMRHGYHHHHHRHHNYHNTTHHKARRDICYPDEVKVVQRVFDILNNYESVDASPLVVPGFGFYPKVRQLRVTDSPFSLKDIDEDGQVDKAAEEFINKFYKELKQQKKIASLESPSPYHKRSHHR